MSSRWFKIFISFSLFVLLLRATDLNAFRERLSGTQIEWVALAFIGYLLSQVLSAYKWRVLALPLGFLQPFRSFVAYYFAGMYLNLFAPSTLAGDLGRGALLAEGRARLGAALQSVVADRISGLVMLLWMCVSGLPFADPGILPLRWRLGVVAAAVGAVAGWWFLLQLLARFFHSENKFRRLFEQLIGPYQHAPRVLAKACALSLLFHFFQFGLQVMIAQALSLEVALWYLVVCVPLINILSGLPISFAGLGVRESGYVLFLAFVGISRERALAFGLLWSAIVLAANAAGGLALVLSPTARLPLTVAKRTSGE
ncbi:MAG TPA: lysylphosphatidylglycerol synthase transmembrane domain-containing protein [Methylomirabilota bacterium]|nr:lysylphosphatidylglycerol synthase transmembrane domain-containing protein [Methylomirabilota bacterium]